MLVATLLVGACADSARPVSLTPSSPQTSTLSPPQATPTSPAPRTSEHSSDAPGAAPTALGTARPGSSGSSGRSACAAAASRLVLTREDDGRSVHVTRDARIDLRAPGSDRDPPARVEGDAVELVRVADAPGRQYELRPVRPGTARVVVPDPGAFAVVVTVCP